MGWSGRAPAPTSCWSWDGATQRARSSAHISDDANTITTIGIDIGKNTFHFVGLDKRGAIVLQRKVSRSQLEPVFAMSRAA